jgi:hypothetical protein
VPKNFFQNQSPLDSIKDFVGLRILKGKPLEEKEPVKKVDERD